MFFALAGNVFEQISDYTSSNKYSAKVIKHQITGKDEKYNLTLYKTYVEFPDAEGKKQIKPLNFTTSNPPKMAEELKIIYKKNNSDVKVASLGENFFSTGVFVIQIVFMIASGLIALSFFIIAFTGRVVLADKLTWGLFYKYVVTFMYIFFIVVFGNIIWLHLLYNTFPRELFYFSTIAIILLMLSLFKYLKKLYRR